MSGTGSRARRVELTHVDGLDGLRGLAVGAVVLYHGGLTWATGGFLGVELFFVLSGFLITSLLIREWLSSGTIVLSNFWARRARRLLPALFVLVVVIGIYYAIKGTIGAVPGLFGDGLSALFYYSNWHQIAIGTSYFAQSGPTSPFQHTWSLAIEEQFYVVWPLLVIGLAFIVTRARRRRGGAPTPPTDREATRLLNVLFGATLVMLIASAADSVLLFHGGSGLNRVYYGTDTRATGLLAGAAFAIILARLRLTGSLTAGSWETAGTTADAESAGRRRRRSRRSSAWLLPVISVSSAVILAASLVLMVKANGDDHWLYPWGFLLTDGMSVALIAVIMTSPRTIANRIFTIEPLRWLGTISYGLYLWHFPLFLWINQTSRVHGVWLFAVRVCVSLIVSILSYYIVEQPIRQRRWPTWMVRGLAPLTAGAGVVSLALAASAAAIPTTSAPVPTTPTTLAGSGPACSVKLSNTASTGAVPPPAAQISSFQTKSLARGTVTWPLTSTTKKFETCPPDRALLVGDSIAFTIGVPYLYNEQSYGMAISNAALLGCAFGIKGELDVNGTWENPSKICANALSGWEAKAKAFDANEVIFELGYRDEFNWRWNGQVVHLGETAFDNYVESRIKDYIKVLGENGKRKLLFLNVPYVDPQTDEANGTPAPQGSTARHDEINKLIRAAVATDPKNASVLSIDQYIAPQGYVNDVNGQLCRFDGIHVTVYCSELLEPRIFKAARGLLDPALLKKG